jgi:hypothetical protein
LLALHLNASISALKRLLAILLLTVFGLPLVSPVFALSRDAGKSLPACCRRSGTHHCMGGMATEDPAASHQGKFLAPVEKCPYYPVASVVVHHDISTPPASRILPASLASHPSGLAQTESKRRISRDRSRQKRGPPASFCA